MNGRTVIDGHARGPVCLNSAMHEQPFPDSEEPHERTRERFERTLEYEERARLGFRRRSAMGGAAQPYGEGSLVYGGIRRVDNGELWGGYLAATALVLGVLAIFYKPLLLGTIALVCAIGGLIAGGEAEKLARRGLIVAAVGFLLGMLFSMLLGFDVI